MKHMHTPVDVSSASSITEEDSIDLSALLRVIWLGKFWILATTLITIFLGGYYAYKIAVPVYQSTAVVMLNNREEQVVDLGNVMGGLNADRSVVNTEVELLRSRNLMAKVVDDLDLVKDPEFNGTLAPPSRSTRLKRYIKELLGGSGELPPPPSEAVQRQITIDSLLRSLTVLNVTDSLVFRVSVQTTSAEKSARIADVLLDLYILNQLEVKFDATEQATTWLTERVTGLQIALEEAEREVNDYRANSSLINPEALRGLEVQANDIRERIASTSITFSQNEERLEALRAAETPQEKVTLADDSQLERLLPRIDDPAIADAFETRFQQIVLRIETEVMRARSQMSTLASSRDSLKLEIEQQSQDLIALQQLTREAEASRLLYEYFLSRLKETSAQQGVQQADSRVISQAVVPRQASAPRKPLILMISAMIGVAIGVAIALLRAASNRSFRTADELEKITGIAVLGQIPLIPSRRRLDAISYLKKMPSSASAEAIRNLRTSVLLSNVDNPPQIVMICSSLSGEGKTTTALSTTLSFASMGKKVLLIEADIRRRIFGQYFKTEQTDGIVAVLSEKKDFEDVVIHSKLIGADILIGDKGQFNAADIFSSKRFSELLAQLRTKYDIIVIDTPPVLLVPDARVIAQHVDAMIFVVKWDTTDRRQVVAALREFERTGRPVSGIALNQISPGGMKRYGYGYGYGTYSNYGSKYYTN